MSLPQPLPITPETVIEALQKRGFDAFLMAFLGDTIVLRLTGTTAALATLLPECTAPPVDTTPLGPTAQGVLQAIERYIKTHGYSPSLREIGAAVGIKLVSTVHGHLRRLEKSGYIALAKGPQVARSIRVLRQADQA